MSKKKYMWTYKIAGKRMANGTPYIKVDFTNGTDSFSREIIATVEDGLKKQIDSQIKQCESNEAFLNSVPEEKYENLEIQTPVLSERDQFLKNYTKLKSLKEGIDLGVFDADNDEYIELLGWVRDNFSSEYFNF